MNGAGTPVDGSAEILDMIAEKFPRVLRSLRQEVYSVEVGQQLGSAVGTFYQELIAPLRP